MQIKIDINEYLKDNVFNLDNIIYNNKKVLTMNKTEIKKICNDYNFGEFLTTSKNQIKLNKTEKKLGIKTIGVAMLPFIDTNKTNINNIINNDIIKYLYKLNHALNLKTFNNDIKNNKIKILIDLCNNSVKSCRINCIKNTGNPLFQKNKNNAMLNRKLLLFNNPSLFLAIYMRLIELESLNCIKNNVMLTNRFNITSDIDFENINIIHNNKKTNFALLTSKYIKKTKLKNTKLDLIPYDYTKNYYRTSLKHYKLVYSISNFKSDLTKIALNNGLSTSLVYDNPNKKPLPKTINLFGKNYDCVNGDEIDYLPYYKTQKIYLLKFKVNRLDNAKIKQVKIDNAKLNNFVCTL